MEQTVTDSNFNELWKVLAEPADKTIHSGVIKQLTDKYPHSNLLHILGARSGNKELIKRAASYFDNRALYRFVKVAEPAQAVPAGRLINLDKAGYEEPQNLTDNLPTTPDDEPAWILPGEPEIDNESTEDDSVVEQSDLKEEVVEKSQLIYQPVAEEKIIAQDQLIEHAVAVEDIEILAMPADKQENRETEDTTGDAVFDGEESQDQESFDWKSLNYDDSTASANNTVMPATSTDHEEEVFEEITGIEDFFLHTATTSPEPEKQHTNKQAWEAEIGPGNEPEQPPEVAVNTNEQPEQKEEPAGLLVAKQGEIKEEQAEPAIKMPEQENDQVKPDAETVTEHKMEPAEELPLLPSEKEPENDLAEPLYHPFTEETQEEILKKEPEAEPQPSVNTDHSSSALNQDIVSSIVATDFFGFEKTLAKEKEPQPQPVAQQDNGTQAAPVLKEPLPEEKQTVAKYHDDSLPYSFLWWLDKTRREQTVYQPYAKAPALPNFAAIQPPKPIQQPVPEIKKENIIERFIHDEPHIKPPSSDKLDNENKARTSAEDSDELVTETLAKIYIDQMLFHKAIVTYKKLILRFPEKSSYFAGQIQLLENRIK